LACLILGKSDMLNFVLLILHNTDFYGQFVNVFVCIPLVNVDMNMFFSYCVENVCFWLQF